MASTLILIASDPLLRTRLISLINRFPQFHCVAAYESDASLPPAGPVAPADLILLALDWSRPGWLGGLINVKSKHPNSPLVVVVPEEEPAHLVQALAHGACGYLPLQAPPGRFLEILEEINRGGSPLPANIVRLVIQCLQRQTSPWQHMPHLSEREKEIFEFLARGYPYKQIADQLAISINTVRTYVRRLYAKLEVPCRAHAVLKCQPLGFGMSPPPCPARPPQSPATPLA